MKFMSALHLNQQRGFSLVTAIFLLVVLAGLGAVMITVTATQHTSSALDVQGARAYQAARAGIEWGAYQAVHGSCAATTTISPLYGELMTNFTVTVTCARPIAAIDGKIPYRLVSTASYGGLPGNVDYVERELQATIVQ
jgi:MSHA biogenesis protein MshP